MCRKPQRFSVLAPTFVALDILTWSAWFEWLNMCLTLAVMSNRQAGKGHETHSQANVSGTWCPNTVCYGQWGSGKDLFQEQMLKKKKKVSLERYLGTCSTGNRPENLRHLCKFRDRSFVDCSVRPQLWCCRTSTALLASRLQWLSTSFHIFPPSSHGSSTQPCPAQVGMCRHLHRHQAANNNGCTVCIYYEYVNCRIPLQLCRMCFCFELLWSIESMPLETMACWLLGSC